MRYSANSVWENKDKYDVVVIGAGHAGCEAALATARLGFQTLVFTVSVDSIAMMPCNPNIGGSSKGHLVRELDALGGEMGKVIDRTFIQSKMLNKSKGPAVHSLRAQADKAVYSRTMRRVLEAQENPYRTTVASKFYEVQKYVTNSNHVPQCNVIFIGKSTFDALPAEYQEMIMRVSEELLPYSQQVADESNADDLQFLQEQGMTFIDFDQIDGMREFLRDATLDKAIERMKESIDPELLDAYLKAAGYSS